MNSQCDNDVKYEITDNNGDNVYNPDNYKIYHIKQIRTRKDGTKYEYEYDGKFKIKPYTPKAPEDKKKVGPHFKKPSSLILKLVETQSENIQLEILAYIESVCLREIMNERTSIGLPRI